MSVAVGQELALNSISMAAFDPAGEKQLPLMRYLNSRQRSLSESVTLSLQDLLSRSQTERVGQMSVVSLPSQLAAGSPLDYSVLTDWFEGEFRAKRLSRAISLIADSNNTFDYAVFNKQMFCLFLRGTKMSRIDFVAEGYYVFRLIVDGGLKQALGAESKEMSGYDASVLSPGDAAMGWSSSTTSARGATGLVIFCRSDFLGEKLQHLGDPACALHEPFSGSRKGSYFRMRLPCTQDMMRLSKSLLELDLSSDLALIKSEGMVLLLVTEFLRSMSAGHAADSKVKRISARDAQRISAARTYIEAHPAENLTVNRIAREVGLNRTKLNDGFRELFGTSVHSFVFELRMLAAVDLMRRDLPLEVVAEHVGYSGVVSLSRAFKKHFGVPPGEYRRAAT
ncbi:MAG: AraC family transcriptional regulator [Pseudomonadota bacterium]